MNISIKQWQAWCLAVGFAAATAGCTSEVVSGVGSGGGGSGSSSTKSAVSATSGQGGATQAVGVTIGSGPSSVAVSSVSAGVGGSTTSSTSAVSTGVGGGAFSCDVAPVIGAFSFCGGAAVGASGGPSECDESFCDQKGNTWDVNCKDDGTCTCSINSKIYCECSGAVFSGDECSSMNYYGCCPVIVGN